MFKFFIGLLMFLGFVGQARGQETGGDEYSIYEMSILFMKWVILLC